MNNIEITEKGSGIDFVWSEDQIQVNVSRIRLHRDGKVTGEVLITTTAKDYAPLLHRAQHNFSSRVSMKQLSNFMAERYPKANWEALVEQLSYHTLEHTRKGEPILELWTYEDVTPPQYLVKPILPKGQPTVLFGDPGVCKSELGHIMAICLMLPWVDNPLGLEVPTKSVRPLILDYETDSEEAKWRLKCLQQGMGLPEFYIPYRRCHIPIYEDLEQIRLAIDECKAEVLIIDSLTAACGGDIKESAVATDFFRALRSLKISSLIIAQTSKENSKGKTILGSTIFTYYSRSVWEVRSTQELGSSEVNVALFHKKANLSQRQPPISMRFNFNGDKTTVCLEDIGGIPALFERMSASQRIIEALRAGTKTANQLTEELELARNTVDQTIRRLRVKHIVYKSGEVVGLIKQEEEDVPF